MDHRKGSGVRLRGMLKQWTRIPTWHLFMHTILLFWSIFCHRLRDVIFSYHIWSWFSIGAWRKRLDTDLQKTPPHASRSVAISTPSFLLLLSTVNNVRCVKQVRMVGIDTSCHLVDIHPTPPHSENYVLAFPLLGVPQWGHLSDLTNPALYCMVLRTSSILAEKEGKNQTVSLWVVFVIFSGCSELIYGDSTVLDGMTRSELITSHMIDK